MKLLKSKTMIIVGLTVLVVSAGVIVYFFKDNILEYKEQPKSAQETEPTVIASTTNLMSSAEVASQFITPPISEPVTIEVKIDDNLVQKDLAIKETTEYFQKDSIYSALLKTEIAVPVFAETAKIYETASFTTTGEDTTTKSKVVATVPVGTMVKIKSISSSAVNNTGYSSPWYEIELTDQEKTIHGYISGSDLPLAYKTLSESKSDKFMFIAGIVSMQDPSEEPKSSIEKERWYPSHDKVAQVRLTHNDKLLAKVSFKPIDSTLAKYNSYSYDVSSRLLKIPNFSSDLYIFALNLSYGACDYPTGDILFTWNGKRLALGPVVEVTNSADYAVSTTYDYIWPKDKNGKPNYLAIRYTETEQNDDEEQGPSKKKEKKAEEKYEYYKWDGEKLNKEESK